LVGSLTYWAVLKRVNYQVNTAVPELLRCALSVVSLSTQTYDVTWTYNNVTVVPFLSYMLYGDVRGYGGVAV
jgi:hypothetical protein